MSDEKIDEKTEGKIDEKITKFRDWMRSKGYSTDDTEVVRQAYRVLGKGEAEKIELRLFGEIKAKEDEWKRF